MTSYSRTTIHHVVSIKIEDVRNFSDRGVRPFNARQIVVTDVEGATFTFDMFSYTDDGLDLEFDNSSDYNRGYEDACADHIRKMGVISAVVKSPIEIGTQTGTRPVPRAAG